MPAHHSPDCDELSPPFPDCRGARSIGFVGSAAPCTASCPNRPRVKLCLTANFAKSFQAAVAHPLSQLDLKGLGRSRTPSEAIF